MELPDGAPAPRLCHLIKWTDFDGYGFNLHSEKTKSNCQYVGKVDNSSPAQAAGLHEGDRIVEVNGVNISTENHRQVVERIKVNPQETRLLVIDPEGEDWYKTRNLVIRGTQSNVIHIKTPVPRPTTTNGNDINGHLEDESQEGTKPEAPNSPLTNFHDLSIPETTSPKTSASETMVNTKEASLSNGNSEEVVKESCNQEKSVKVDRSHEVSVNPEPELVSKSPNKLIPSSPTQLKIVTKPSESIKENCANKTCDSINNNNIEEEKSKKNSLRKESGLSNEAASSSSRSSTCGSPDHLDHQRMIVTANESKMQPSNGSARTDDVNIEPMTKHEPNGMNHAKNGSSGSRGSSLSTGSIPASPTSMKSSGSTNTSKEPTSIANFSTGSPLTIMSTNGRPPSESDKLEMSLNMSVSEMREMLARKKKQDPKKAQMDLKQKYEIIQQM